VVLSSGVEFLRFKRRLSKARFSFEIAEIIAEDGLCAEIELA
jgi:hypothetical protein